MNVLMKITEYDPKQGMRFNWEHGFSIETRIDKNAVIISANEAGLRSLANHLITLAQKTIPSEYHFHLDDSNGLEEGSCELIIEKS